MNPRCPDCNNEQGWIAGEGYFCLLGCGDVDAGGRSNVVALNRDATAEPDPPARLYAVERAALHFLDLAMRIRREAELGELTAEVVGLLGERLDACAVAVAGLGDE